MPDFTEILSKKAVEAERPPPRPTGTYLAQVSGFPKQKEQTIQGEDRKILSFAIRIIAPHGDDVDLDQLNAPGQGDISSWPPFTRDIWDVDQPNGEYALRQFLTKTLGIDEGEGKSARSFGEMLADANGKQLLVTLKHNPYTDKSTGEMVIGTQIGSTAKV